MIQMKKSKKILSLMMLLGVMVLVGCGRSDIVLTVNGDGSFHATVSYGITKDLVANDDAMNDAKALITDSLDKNSIPYTEGENDEYVTVTVEKDFADLTELTSREAWQGIGFVPYFTSINDGSGIWTRYEEGRLKFSGTLNSDTFNARGLLGDMEDPSVYGGSLRIVLPEAAEAFAGGQMEDDAYVWSGTGADSLTLDLVTTPIFEAQSANDTETAEEEAKEEVGNTAARSTTVKDGLVTALVVLVIIAVAAGVVIVAKKKK